MGAMVSAIFRRVRFGFKVLIRQNIVFYSFTIVKNVSSQKSTFYSAKIGFGSFKTPLEHF